MIIDWLFNQSPNVNYPVAGRVSYWVSTIRILCIDDSLGQGYTKLEDFWNFLTPVQVPDKGSTYSRQFLSASANRRTFLPLIKGQIKLIFFVFLKRTNESLITTCEKLINLFLFSLLSMPFRHLVHTNSVTPAPMRTGYQDAVLFSRLVRDLLGPISILQHPPGDRPGNKRVS